MSTSSSINPMDSISSSYQSTKEEKADTEATLGREEFLTLLVAQLQNQDPLNPMEGTDFSTQLAEFSQLEQLMNLNESMDSFSAAVDAMSQGNATDYIGKQVTGEVNSMQVSEGEVSGGFYNLASQGDVIVDITDADGNSVDRLYLGQQDSGSHLISWDGTDSAGDAVDDGTYYYTVYADSGSGYLELSNSVTGTVDGITYLNGKPYLVVQGILMDVDSLTAVDGSVDSSSDTVDSVFDYLGNTISSDAPLLLVDDDALQGGDLSFEMTDQEAVTVTIYDAYGNEVRAIDVAESSIQTGANTIAWDGLGNDGYHVDDGLYYYTVKTDSGLSAATPVSGEVTAIKTVNSTQYLVLEDSGRLVALSTVDDITKTAGTL